MVLTLKNMWSMRKQETPNLALGTVFGALRDALTKPGVTADGS